MRFLTKSDGGALNLDVQLQGRWGEWPFFRSVEETAQLTYVNLKRCLQAKVRCGKAASAGLREEVDTNMTDASEYGDFYWRIHLADGKDLWLYAESFDVRSDGSLVFIGKTRPSRNVQGVIHAFAAGVWRNVGAASLIVGHLVAVHEREGDT